MRTAAVRVSLVAILCVSATAIAAGWSPAAWIGLSSTPRSAPVTATMAAAMLNDADSDGKADPGESIRYTATLSAHGEDANDVHFSVPLDARTTLIDGSITISPIARNDAYTSPSSTPLDSASMGGTCAESPLRSVTCNDGLNGAEPWSFGATEGEANGMGVNGSNAVTTSSGGSVVLASDGTFVYTPYAEFNGEDSFWYTVAGAAGSDTAQVTITVVGPGNDMALLAPSGAPVAHQRHGGVASGLRALTVMAGNLLVARVEASPMMTQAPVDLELGMLPADKTVTIIFDVMVGEPAAAQYSTEGTVTGSSFENVVTDPATIEGDRYNTAVLLTSSHNPASSDAQITFSAAVSTDAAVMPPGTVQFKDGVTNLGSPVTCIDNGDPICRARLTTALPVGTHDITAEFSGADSFDPSTSDSLSQVVYGCTTNPTVTVNADSGEGSLRQAILDACSASIITFDGVVSPIDLTSGQLTIERELTIVGPGAYTLTVERASGMFRIFAVAPRVTAIIEGLTIANGLLPQDAEEGGAAVFNDGGTLTVRNAVLSGGTAWVGGAILSTGNRDQPATLTVVDAVLTGNTALAGGAVVTFADDFGTSTASIINSTLSGNSAMIFGGGIAAVANAGALSSLSMINSTVSGNSSATAGGIYLRGDAMGSSTLQLTQVTISGNSATTDGGGMVLAETQTTITNSTITGNRADRDASGQAGGGGIFVSSGDIRLNNTIVAGNVAGSAMSFAQDDVYGDLSCSSGFNLIGVDAHMSGVVNDGNGNQVGTLESPIDPRLGPLTFNGGPTYTHALLAGSPALDAGENGYVVAPPFLEATPIKDARGYWSDRIRDSADAGTTATVDIGALEADPSIEDIADQSTGMGTPVWFLFGVGDGSTAFDSITATSSNTVLLPDANAVVSDASGSRRQLTLTPAAGQVGTTTVTVTVMKMTGGVPTRMSDTFVLTVATFSAPPTLDAIDNPTAVLENAGAQTVDLTGITAGGGQTQVLTVTASSDNHALIPDPTVTYTSAASTSSLSYTPVAQASGTAVVTVTVTDDGGGADTFSRTFTVAVTRVNDDPTISDIANQQAPASQSTMIPFTVGDLETAATDLTVTATSSNQTVVASSGLSVSGSGSSRTLTLSPVANATGVATITVTVTDGDGGTAVDTFVVTVVPRLTILDAAATEGNSGTTLLTFTVKLAGASQSTVSVTYATAQRTAVAGVDYVSRTGTVSFNPGVTGSTPIAVTVNGDTAVEINETFVVNLTGATGGAVIARAQGIGSIVDDDEAVNQFDQHAALAVWTSPVGVTAPPGTLTKTVNLGWSAGAVSSQALLGGDGSMEFTASETTAIRAAGLSHGNSSTDFADIDFAIELYEGRAYVVEDGATRGQFGIYATGDRFAVAVEHAAVVYRKNGVAFYTSSVAPVYPLLVDTALYTPASTITDVVLSGRLARPVAWTNLTGTSAGLGTLTKTAVAGWNAGAASTRGLISGDGAVELTATETNTTRMLGLSRDNSNTDYSDIDFGLYLYSNATVYIVEGGVTRGIFGSYATGDRFQVAIESGQAVYKRNGVPLYTSGVTPVYPLLVDAALFTPGATLTDVTLAGTFATDVAFGAGVRVGIAGNTLTKTGTLGWNAQALSTRALVTGDGFVEFTTNEATSQKMAGLSHGDAGTDFADVDFGILLTSTRAVYVYEAGVSRGVFGTYVAGDRFRVSVEGGIVKYRRNGVLLYTSGAVPVYPLLVDTGMYTPGATIADVVLAGDLGAVVVWTAEAGVTAAGGTLTKVGTLGWNAAAISTRAIGAGDGFVSFTTSEATTHKVVGLSHGNTNTDYTDVDFGVLLASNGTFYVFEAGVSRGMFGGYVAGDRFEVGVTGGVVIYLKNSVVFYTSGVAPVYPLLVDTALYTPGATIGDVVLGCTTLVCQ